jgi:hypothetical protein
MGTTHDEYSLQEAAFGGRLVGPVSGRLRTAINAFGGIHQEIQRT